MIFKVMHALNGTGIKIHMIDELEEQCVGEQGKRVRV